MALYKLLRNWGGFEKGQVIEVKSPDRFAAMNGDEVNPPAGVLYVESKPEVEAEPIIEKINTPEPKVKGKGTTGKKGLK